MSASTASAPTAFERFGLHDHLLRGVRAAGFECPRPIQMETIPAGLDGRDVMGLAHTGTGKTAAFALPILDSMLRRPGKGPRALVVAPTRELATQIAEEMRMLARYADLWVTTIYGGVSQHHQAKALRKGPHVVVGCPGRLLDLYQQKILRLDGIETLVLDEADHMFDMGFLPDIKKILNALPDERQNMLFSATMPHQIRHLAQRLLRDPHVVELADSGPVETIDHALYPVTQRRKRDLLERILEHESCDSAIVFTRTKHRAKRLAQQLSKAGHKAVGLQGNLSQSRRDKAMKGFRTRRYDILVATDIAARGIDVSDVSHVINFDVPNTPEAYTHRIGRTGRSGQEGTACTFVTNEDKGWVRATERMLGSAIPRRQVEGFEGNGGGERSGRPAKKAAGPRKSRKPKGRGRNSAGRRRRRGRKG